MRQTLISVLRALRQGYLIWPLGLALAGVALAFMLAQVDRTDFVRGFTDRNVGGLQLSPSAARDVLSVVATGTVTILSLVYSMTLVVFTLAASALGNRIIRTFGDNLLGQITAGVLAATFLFALTAIYLSPVDHAPFVSTAVSVAMALACVLLLISFVNDVSKRIQIDNELARIQRILSGNVVTLKGGASQSSTPQSMPDTMDFPVQCTIASITTGYITRIEKVGLLAIMTRHDGWMMMQARQGDFVLEGEAIATVWLREEGPDHEALGRQVAGLVAVDDARAPGDDILFNIHLMVEIALRALSSGVNDSYTAIAAIDQMSASLVQLLANNELVTRIASPDNVVRIIVQPITVSAVLAAGLHPIRRAAGRNVLVMLALARGLERLARHSSAQYGDVLRKHIRLVTAEARDGIDEPEDRQALAEKLWAARLATKSLPG